MIDFVRVLEQYCVSKGIEHHYGRQANLNLLKSDLLLGKIYCLQEQVKRRPEMNLTGTRPQAYVFSGLMFLLKKSTLDMPYYKEVGGDGSNSKYVLNIEPLLTEADLMLKALTCLDLEILLFESDDVVNVLNTNNDGVLINYQIRSRVN